MLEWLELWNRRWKGGELWPSRREFVDSLSCEEDALQKGETVTLLILASHGQSEDDLCHPQLFLFLAGTSISIPRQ